MGTALSMSFDGRRYRSQFGGGPRKRFFNVHEIRGCVNEKGEELALRSTQYDLLSYVPLNKVPAELARYEGSMACKAPFTVILPHLTVPELKDVCRMHGILTSSRCLRHELLEKLKEHTCHDDCVLSIAILKACDTQGGSDRASLLDIEDPELVKTAALFSPDDLGDKLPNHLRCSANVLFKLVAITRQSAGDNNDDIVWMSIRSQFPLSGVNLNVKLHLRFMSALIVHR
ncbi:hypothetical protein EST38_g9619 [Candolleomyces aberdarensis]|uniref:SAP domain-containing protein n=1 Tax=Candolleomyces aberdarensis TaxID=2316362 RepID=A0A4Q2DA61_9AGAR|nr:hypothetical protein EST38_g9619 [Candolleomyces aberdarensis]